MSIFKETFHENIQSQLNARQSANEKRDTNSIKYLNSRQAWIRMTSAVMINGSDALAKANILLGGVLYNNNLKSGVGNNPLTAYSTVTPANNPNRLGMRPMPGITGIEVKSKSQYGSLREAVIKFVCWDIKQLEELEVLYMRPGYTAMLEWGWAPYLDNSGNIVGTPEFIDDVLNGGVTKEEIWKNIYNQSKLSGNYDAIYGKVQKYSWSARPDGGYDCTTTLITIGEVLESLKVNYGTADTNLSENGMFGMKAKDEQLFQQNGNLNIAYTQSKLAGILAEIWYLANDQIKDSPGSGDVDLGNEDKFKMFKLQLSVNNSEEKNKSDFLSDNNKIFITLKDFVKVLNKYILLHDGSPLQTKPKPFVEVSVNEGEYKEKGDRPLLCLGNKLQFSIDPTVCLIKNMSPEALEVIKGADIRKDNKPSVTQASSTTTTRTDNSTEANKGGPVFVPSGEGLSPIKELIASGEGNYQSYNYYAGNKLSSVINPRQTSIINETVDQIIQKQSARIYFAVGKYQLIPQTFTGTVVGKIPGNQLFDATTQEKVGDLLVLEDRPGLGNYLKGKNNGTLQDLETAVIDAARIWASLPTVERGYGAGSVVTGVGNTTRYGGQGGNRSTTDTSIGTLASALIKSRIQYSGKQPEFIPTYYT